VPLQKVQADDSDRHACHSAILSQPGSEKGACEQPGPSPRGRPARAQEQVWSHYKVSSSLMKPNQRQTYGCTL
jgi:hypothetical protein